MKALVDPWHQSLANPANAQEIVLERLLNTYKQTEYGRDHRSENVGSYDDYKKAFPVQTFIDFNPFIDEVKIGNTHVLLSEEPVVWGLTKGTSGESKFFPFTPTHVKNYVAGINRVFFNHALSTQNIEWMTGYRLSLSSSGYLGTIIVGKKEMRYGYSFPVGVGFMDKTYGQLNRVTPTQDEINKLPGGSTKLDWETRHEFVYQKSRERNVTHTISSPNILLGFGRYIYRKHHVYPKDLWQTECLISGAFPGVNTRFAPPIHALFGKSANIRDLYVATEGIFGGQIDDKKAWSPFYDYMFFEIQTINGIKQLHEMYPGEVGSLIVSTPVFPRYRIGDLILAFEPPYFRCIGRENTKLNPYYFGKLTGKSDSNFPKSNNLNTWR
jgi:hypothetical protein